MARSTITSGGYHVSGNFNSVGSLGTVTLSGAHTNTNTIASSITAPNANFYNGSGTPIMTIPHNDNKIVVEENAALEVKGRIKLNGEYLDERLERIETLLNIPTRDITMEHKYPKLKELWEAYNRELAKYKTWDKLKDSE